MTIGTPLEPSRRQEAGDALQALLVDLIALSLVGKQAHWHVTGPSFLPVHEQLDQLVDSARTHADDVAERAVTLGVTVDGQPVTIATVSKVAEIPQGYLDAEKAVQLVADETTGVVERSRARLDRLGEVDPVTQDLVIEVLRDLEKQLWMLQAQITHQA